MKSLSSIATFFADILFPRQCIGCSQTRTLLCDTCLRSISSHPLQPCHHCKQTASTFGELCIRCTESSPLNGLFFATDYRQPIIKSAIRAFKYRHIESLQDTLALLLTAAIKQSNIPIPDIIFPVPLHPLRLRARGFNQSEKLAQSVAETLFPNLSIPIDTDRLTRHRFTLPQAKFSNKNDRLNNVSAAFSWRERHDTQPLTETSSVWILDDVATTKATLEACAAILKQNGATKVYGVVLAH